MIELSFYAVEDAMEQVVDEVGFEYRYLPPGATEAKAVQSCYNWHENDCGEKVPGCIVGTVLHRLGVPLDAMFQTLASSQLLVDLERREVIKFIDSHTKERIEVFLRTAQVAQDAGATWYSAFKVARNVVMYLD